MSSISNPIALAALHRALGAAKRAPTPRVRGDSRTADKFVIRGYVEMYVELEAIGRYHGRSRNSEAQTAVLEALNGWKRSTAELNLRVEKLGKTLSRKILTEIPVFDLSMCETEDRFVLRFPPNVRDKVRDGVENRDFDEASMNDWFLTVLVRWINLQRMSYAMLSAAIELDPNLVDPNYHGS